MKKKMRVKRKSTTLLFYIMMTCALMAVLVTACEPMSKEKEQIKTESLSKVDTSVPKNVEKHLKMEITDNIKLDADIVGLTDLEEYKLPEYDCTLHCFDEIQTFNYLCDYFQLDNGGEEILSTEESLPNGESIKKIENRDESDSLVLQARTTYAWGENNKQFNANVVGFSEDFDYLIPGDMLMYKDFVPQDKDLSFMEMEEAESKSREFVENMGVELIDYRKCYSATYKEFTKYVEDAEIYKQPCSEYGMTTSDFNESMDAYRFDFYIGYRNVPILKYETNPPIDGTFDLSNACSVVYDSSGIISFEVTSMYDMIPDSVGEDKEICDLSTIIENFSDNMDGVITDKEVTVKEIGLAYVPILSDADSLTYHATPFWYVIYDQPNSIDGNITREMKVYDAYSGENI